ncbi:MAG TPA: hypothetical protein VF761_05570 [Gemmatimonadaceae bacterium]
MKYAAAKSAEDARRRYVWVEEDGSVRDLTDREAEHLATPFEGPDGARPYIKSRLKSRTPDGRLVGYLERSQLLGEKLLRIYGIVAGLVVIALLAMMWYQRRG